MTRNVRLLRQALAIAAAMALYGAGPAEAVEFQRGDVKGSFDTTLSLGAAWRVERRDPALIGITNGGTSRSVNDDDGDLNYDRGDVFSTLFKVTHELDLKYRNFGFFTRLLYFYDHAVERKDELSSIAKSRIGSDFEFLDVFFRGQFDVGGRNLTVRAGRQVVSWGESTFIPNGINVINPVDVARLRTPGAEIKEALLPSGILWITQELTERVTLEGYYQTNWSRTEIDPRGTYFSANDFISDGGGRAFIGFGRRLDDRSALVPPVGPTAATAQVWVQRGADRDPDEQGQYGLAARFFLEALNNSEIGVYYLNYHSRLPLVSTIRGTTTNLANLPAGGGSARYFIEYPEDIRLWGLSFSTGAPYGIALQGEYSYRPNQPLQLAAIEVLLATLGFPNNVTGTQVIPVGTEIQGYRRVKMHQAQLTATKVFGPQWGAEQLVVVGEVGYTNLDLPSGLLFSGPGVQLPAPGSFAGASAGSVQPGGDGFATESSWGYRLVGRLDYFDAIGAVTVSPRLAFAHDVRGVSPTFNHGTKAVTLGFNFNLRQNWQADIAYTNFFGGRTFSGTDAGAIPPGQSRAFASGANPLKDRDFIAASVSYSF
ncbi:MAG: DUF1302 domain-containing protein [Betaproteobacteria bacterium]|nr:DUF1302 domain-containing protein [Betaproteobacteria bacterium]